MTPSNWHPLAGWRAALAGYGWLVLVAILSAALVLTLVVFPEWGLDTTPTHDDQHVTKQITQTLEVAPPLPTAHDLCLDPSIEIAHFPADDHFEANLVQNSGQLNQVKYHLFWRPDRRLDVVIEEARAGQPVITRTDPHTEQFARCVRGHRITEVTLSP